MKNLLILFLLIFTAGIFASDSTSVDSTKVIDTAVTNIETKTDSTKTDSLKAERISKKEKARKDSVEFEEKKLLMILRSTFEKGVMTIQPKSPDSIITYDTILPHQVMQTDGLNFSSILNKNPLFIPVYRNITSSYNNSLYYGIPAPILTIRSSGEIVSPYPYRVPYGARFSPKEVYSVKLTPNVISAELFPQDFLVPHTSILWEGGISSFRENMLNVRFTRPMTERLQLGVFTNYQHFNRMYYSHPINVSSGWSEMYSWIDADKSKLSVSGYNPYTNEFDAVARLLYLGKNESKLKLSYSYSDNRNDFPTPPIENKTDSLSMYWKEDINYTHRVNGGLYELSLTPKLFLNSQFFFNSHKNRLRSTTSYDDLDYEGYNLSAGGGLHPYLLINEKDTASLTFSAQRDENERYDKSRLISQDIRLKASYFKNYKLGKINGNAAIDAGAVFVKMNDERESSFLASLSSDNRIGRQKLSLNASHTIIPPQIPFDNSNSIAPDSLIDPYWSFGGEALFRVGTHSMLLGYKGIRDLKARSDSLFWSPGLPPYKTSENNFIVTPTLFTGKKISLSSSWIFADSKPHVKSKSSLLFHIHKKGRVQHTFLSFDFMYWSERESMIFAEDDNWNREVFDLNFHATVQIKTFRLFYKIDNLMNRANTFAPGFYMPGLILRWGFNWQITG